MLFCLFCFVCFWCAWLFFLGTNLVAVSNGLSLWANRVVPSLLPFFIGTELLMHTNIVSLLGKLLTPIMKPAFNVPGEGAFVLLMGIICGYPTGARIVCELRNNGILTKTEAERLLSFTNNSGPLFIIGTVGVSLFGDTRTGLLLLITHVLACITVGICFRFWSDRKRQTESGQVQDLPLRANFSNLGEILGNCIMNSVRTIVMIGGFVVLFSVIVSILKQSHIIDLVCFALEPVFSLFGVSIEFLPGLFTGVLELTNGVSEVALVPSRLISTNMILCSFCLGLVGFQCFYRYLVLFLRVIFLLNLIFMVRFCMGVLLRYIRF